MMSQESLVRASSENLVEPPLVVPPGMTPSAKGGVAMALRDAAPPIRILTQAGPDRGEASICNATGASPPA